MRANKGRLVLLMEISCGGHLRVLIIFNYNNQENTRLSPKVKPMETHQLQTYLVALHEAPHHTRELKDGLIYPHWCITTKSLCDIVTFNWYIKKKNSSHNTKTLLFIKLNQYAHLCKSHWFSEKFRFLCKGRKKSICENVIVLLQQTNCKPTMTKPFLTTDFTFLSHLQLI